MSKREIELHEGDRVRQGAVAYRVYELTPEHVVVFTSPDGNGAYCRYKLTTIPRGHAERTLKHDNRPRYGHTENR